MGLLEDTCGARRERKGNMKETFGVPVRSTYTKAAYKWVPYLTFDLGLLGGVATMHAQAGGFENESSVSFEYKDNNQYCPDDQCVALYQAGLVCVVLLSLSVAASFVALIVEVVVMLQLGNVLSETGPFGPY